VCRGNSYQNSQRLNTGIQSKQRRLCPSSVDSWTPQQTHISTTHNQHQHTNNITMPDSIATESFPFYVVEAKEAGPYYYLFVLLYTVLAFLLIVPLVRLGRHFNQLAQEAAAFSAKKKAGQQQHQQQQQQWVDDEYYHHHQQQLQHGNAPGLMTGGNKSSDITNQTASEGQSSLSADDVSPSQPDESPVAPTTAQQQQSTPTPPLPQQQQQQQQQLVRPPPRMPSINTNRSERSFVSRRSRSQVHSVTTNNKNINSTINNTTNNINHPAASTDQASTTQPRQPTRRPSAAGSAALGFVFRGLDRVASAEYPDRHPDFASQLSGSAMLRRQSQKRNSATGNAATRSQNGVPRRPSSAIQSVATTSKLRQAARMAKDGTGGPQGPTMQQGASGAMSVAPRRVSPSIWDVNGRRWKTRRPIGRVDTIRNAVRRESFSMKSSDKMNFAASRQNQLMYLQQQQQRQMQLQRMRQSGVARNGTMSDMANGMLGQHQHHNTPAGVVIHPSMLRRMSAGSQRHHGFNANHNRFVVRRMSRQGSFSTLTGSEPSIMPPIVDDIAPGDAADADDPGQGNIFMGIQENEFDAPAKSFAGSGYGVKMGCCTPFLEGLLELAEIDEEGGRVLRLSLPLTIGAMSEPFFRFVTVGFISNYLGADSMIAFLLVILFVRLTTEQLAGAIIDALSSFVQQAIYSGNSNSAFLAGQYVQLAVILQLLLGAPLLAVWVLYMENVVDWLVESTTIAKIAGDYTSVIVFNYLVQAIGRTSTVVFHICGHEHFESVIDFCSQMFSMITVACIVTLKDGADLTVVAYVQLFIGIATTLIKLLYPITKGWVKPFRTGLIQTVALYHNFNAFVMMGLSTLPLLLGTFLEFGEWELLTIFLQYLGPAEVATWALLGNLWEILEASTEGIGEAASIRVAYILSMADPDRARKLTNKAIYMSVIESIIITSILFISGRNIAVLMTTDRTIQHLFNETINMLGLAHLTMSFAQICWSLIGAQGRYRLATIIMFFSRWLFTMPIALAVIFAFYLDLNAIIGAVTVGYATASCTLCYVVLRSDWERLARIMQEVSAPATEDEDDLAGLEGLDLDDFENDDDDDDDDEYDYDEDEESSDDDDDAGNDDDLSSNEGTSSSHMR